MPPIISIENLGKSYLIGHQSKPTESYTALRDVIGEKAKSLGRKALNLARGRQIVSGDHTEEFWALRDVSFDISPGEVIGVIGCNGAGKSTLLKILSRITEPTRGRICLNGRVASLLEVGTGFHPELTGRENILLNGAILGMKRSEIRDRFDEIVAFAEVEKFLDTPVKRYSSGMYVRLAFAVAAHLTPEILLIDEVLAVGDAEFQKRCLGKMKNMSESGRTVVFVSHDLAAIHQLAKRGICIDGGTIVSEGPISDVISHYLATDNSTASAVFESSEKTLDPSALVSLVSADVRNSNGAISDTISFREPFSVRFHVRNSQPIQGASYAMSVFDSNNRHVAAFNSHATPSLENSLEGTHEVVCDIQDNCLLPGTYRIRTSGWRRPSTTLFMVDDCLQFTVSSVAYDQTQPFTVSSNPIFVPRTSWSKRELAAA